MKKMPWIIVLILLIINLGLVYVFIIKGKTYQDNDQRVTIEMTKGNKDFVMQEMRDFLESVQQINEGIINEDAQKIINAGNKSGGSVIEHAPKGLMATLPLPFKKLGFSTHDMFDDIAKNATEKFQAKESQKQLNSLLKNCIACHSSFKIETKK